ncbi:MAG: YbaK/EbsC family protein [Hespellia sp.]|nr:YbaK/EbsC family protein [Hespellia sp.]
MSLEKVQKYLQGTELEEKIIVLEESSATVELAAKALGCEPDRIAKTLSFLLDEQPILIVVSGESKIDNKKYKAQFHTKAKMIPFGEVEKWIGHAPGGVCPFGVKENVKVYLDESLKQYEVVFPAAGSGNSAVEMTIPQLEKYSGNSEWIDVSKK